jgi:hypothetical protein
MTIELLVTALATIIWVTLAIWAAWMIIAPHTRGIDE